MKLINYKSGANTGLGITITNNLKYKKYTLETNLFIKVQVQYKSGRKYHKQLKNKLCNQKNISVKYITKYKKKQNILNP